MVIISTYHLFTHYSVIFVEGDLLLNFVPQVCPQLTNSGQFQSGVSTDTIDNGNINIHTLIVWHLHISILYFQKKSVLKIINSVFKSTLFTVALLNRILLVQNLP